MMKKYNYLVSLILIFVGAAMIYLTKDFPYDGLKDVGGGFFPKVVGGLMILLSILVIIDTAVKPASEVTIDFKDPGLQKLLIMCVILFLYCFIIRLTGFMIATALMVAGCIVLLGERNWKKIAAVDTGILVFIYIVFELLLHTQLPGGMLFR